MKLSKNKICVLGMGYVGLPLAVEFGKIFNTIGFDINKERIKKLKKFIDINAEVSSKEIKKSIKIYFSSKKEDLVSANIFIITVPTPINKRNNPDLSLLKSATRLVGNSLKKGDIVIYESTVYPGTTEEVCVPILENISKLEFKKDFNCGYSPERINPGDKKRSLKNIDKIVSGSNKITLDKIFQLYNQIIKADVHKISSIRVAEAAKVIENTQRDLNIALINELSIIFNKLDIDSKEVLDAAKTKWNFIPYSPGLVGGHCIGVDPYYLTYKAKSVGYSPKVILAGRNINNRMGSYIVSRLNEQLKKKQILKKRIKVLIMGLAFKENCHDIRNSGSISILKNLKKDRFNTDVYDPWAYDKDAYKYYNIRLKKKIESSTYDAVIISVGHKIFKEMGIGKIKSFCKSKNVIFDVKRIFNNEEVDLFL